MSNKSANMPLGYIVYKGPSLIEPSREIVMVVNCVHFPSSNEKTGPLAQTWIMGLEDSPKELIRAKNDQSVCGGCLLAGGEGCYVNRKTIESVYGAYTNKTYRESTPEQAAEGIRKEIRRGRLDGLRCGSYGDPAAVPYSVWDPLLAAVEGKVQTGYTHQWNPYSAYNNYVASEEYKRFLMASCHGAEEAHLATSLGWRPYATFESVEEIRRAGLGVCPGSREQEGMKTCATCGKRGACNGRQGMEDKRKGMGIVVHGSSATLYRIRRSLANRGKNGTS